MSGAVQVHGLQSVQVIIKVQVNGAALTMPAGLTAVRG